MASTETTNLLDELRDQILREHALIHHPFMKAAIAGELTPEQVRGFVRDFWVIPHSHLINNAGKLAHAQLLRGPFSQQLLCSPYDKGITELLGESLADELGKTEISPVSHYDPYIDLATEVGIPENEIGNVAYLSPQAVIVMYTWTQTALNFSLLELLSSHNFVHDTANVVAYPPFCEALKRHYGLSSKAVRWFDLHGEVDKEHGSRARDILERLVRTEDDRQVARSCVRLGLGVFWCLLDGVMDRYVRGEYPTDAQGGQTPKRPTVAVA
jgi:pyrroloquinoline quinone (PQQ) biosynthesis protein C